MTIDHLIALCKRNPPAHRAWTGQPFVLDWQGKPWTGATNGVAALLLAGEMPGVSRRDKAGAMLPILNRQCADQGTEVAFADLLQFVGLPQSDTICPKCNGKKAWTCQGCHDGMVSAPDRHGRIGKCFVRLNILAPYLQGLAAERVTLTEPDDDESPLWIEAPEWVVLIMPALPRDSMGAVRVFGEEVAHA